ncbi:hypothetical protein [Staphylococcus xylosus]|nr:hypothetical protein CW747_09610 [Staphylococcus shinii]
MENINLILGICASLLTIGSICYTCKVSCKNKEIERILNQNFNIKLNTSNRKVYKYNKSSSGDNSISISGDNNISNSGDKNEFK